MAEMVMHRRRSAREQEMAKAAAEARQDNVPVSFRRAGHEPASVEVRSPTHPRAQNSVRGAKVRPGPSVETVGRSFMKRNFTDKEQVAARKIILFWKRRTCYKAVHPAGLRMLTRRGLRCLVCRPEWIPAQNTRARTVCARCVA